MSGNLARRIEGDQTENAREMFSNVRRLRLLSRRRVSIHAVVTTTRQHLHVEIRNISQSGAGMRIDGRAAIDEPVTLHFSDGRTVDAHVRWTRSYFCGVEFASLLPFDDPLLGELTIAAKAPTAASVDAKAQPAVLFSAPAANAIAVSALRAIAKSALRVMNQLRGSIVTTLIRNRLKQDAHMVQRAVRKQGSSWLVDIE